MAKSAAVNFLTMTRRHSLRSRENLECPRVSPYCGSVPCPDVDRVRAAHVVRWAEGSRLPVARLDGRGRSSSGNFTTAL